MPASTTCCSSTVWIGVLQGLLTPTIALVVAYVAWQQWRLGKRRMRLDLYDRRKRIYEELRRLFEIVSRDANIDIRDLADYWIKVSEADFLFDSDINDYLKLVYEHGRQLWKWNKSYKESTQIKPPGYDHAKVVDGIEEEMNWFLKQAPVALKKFRKYLSLHSKET